jgi:hypothetical protein
MNEPTELVAVLVTGLVTGLAMGRRHGGPCQVAAGQVRP